MGELDEADEMDKVSMASSNEVAGNGCGAIVVDEVWLSGSKNNINEKLYL